MTSAQDKFTTALAALSAPEPKLKVAAPTAINPFQHPDAHPVVLDLLLLRAYGPEWLTWDTETLLWRIPRDFDGKVVSDLCLDKLQAMKTLHVSDGPWLEWEQFVWCCMPLADIPPDFEIMQVPEAEEMARAVHIFQQVRTDVAWSDEVKAFVGQCLIHDNLLCRPYPLEFADFDSALYPIDCELVGQHWPAVRTSRRIPTIGAPEQAQLRRMLEIQDALDADTQRLEDQSKVLLP